MAKKMRRRQRPPTAWIDHCSRSVRASSGVGEDAARRICAASWWHRMPRSSQRRAFLRHEPGAGGAHDPERRRGKKGAGYCRICRGPHVFKHGR